jgi:AcrR family transcriptional regulator
MPSADADTRRGRPLAGGAERVREAGTRLFAKQGYSGTNMKDLGEELGVQAPSLYNYVDSKQQILDDIVLGYFSALYEAVTAGISLADDAIERARRGVEEQSRFKLGHRDAMVVSERDRLHLSEPVARRVSEYDDEIRELWSDVVVQGVENGSFTAPHIDIVVEVLVDLAASRQIRSLTSSEDFTESKLAYWFGDIAVQLLTSS